jgi:hypothetical protein
MKFKAKIVSGKSGRELRVLVTFSVVIALFKI